jgi:cobalt/nickel transport protein
MGRLSRRSLLFVIICLLISPIFGIILADWVGYHEPLDIAAEKLGLNESSYEFFWTPFADYTFPGLPSILGYMLSGAVGVLIIILIGTVISASRIYIKEDESETK